MYNHREDIEGQLGPRLNREDQQARKHALRILCMDLMGEVRFIGDHL